MVAPPRQPLIPSRITRHRPPQSRYILIVSVVVLSSGFIGEDSSDAGCNGTLGPGFQVELETRFAAQAQTS